MLKKITIFFFFLFSCLIAKADHITGGQMWYTYNGFSNGMYNYSFTLQLYMRCFSDRRFNDPTTIVVYNKGNNTTVATYTVQLRDQETISIQNHNKCITDPPIVCYEVGTYFFNVSVPGNIEGYIVASQVNYRINGINNLLYGYSQVGATYTAEIPGTQNGGTPANRSARFTGSDLVVVCANNNFSYSFAAQDSDGDELRYFFCDAYRSGSSGINSAPPPPPYYPVPYGLEFSGISPLGRKVQLNQSTGLITGIAPSEGVYVVTVCVQEIRNGKVIATQRKDLQIHIAPCQIAAASLPQEFMLCKDSKTITFENLSNSPLIKTYNWEITSKSGETLFTSNAPKPSYTFSDTGRYNVKLVINRGEECADSIKSVALVYPGLLSDFKAEGVCFLKPTEFKDASTTVFGNINSWEWSVGEVIVSNDFAGNPAPSYIYKSKGEKNIELIVGTTTGCKDTATKTINITDKPSLNLAFRDSLICITDKVQLSVSGIGNFQWSPANTLSQSSGASPIASPNTTTIYTVEINDNGCINSDSVIIRVTDHVNLEVMPDTTICQNDPILLRIKSNALQYNWTPSSQIDNAGISQPIAVTPETTIYEVTANIGSCIERKTIKVNAVPYPVVIAGPDTTICYGTEAQLSLGTDGRNVIWSPATGLSNSTITNPVTSTLSTRTYFVSAFDTRGCPKAGRDSVTVFVLPKIEAFAGRDTNVVIGQFLQLNATGGSNYQWVPSTGLSSASISNPVANYNGLEEKIKYTVYIFSEAGCIDSAYLTVKIFNTAPSVFVPTAFTPNSDGLNDRLKPTVAGMNKVDYFLIYNRWGKLVFNGDFNVGWDGKFNNIPQETGVFLWIVKSIDHLGQPFFKKGTTTLIR